MPVYLQIRNSVRDAIASGTLASGDLVPSETLLAKQFGTTRATVVHAMQQLVFEGVVERKRGIGTFVASRALHSTLDTRRVGYFEQDMSEEGENVSYKLVHFGASAVEGHVRERLKIGASEAVFSLQRLRLLSGRPIALELRYMPASIGKRLSEGLLSRYSVQALLNQHSDTAIHKFVNTVRVALVPQNAAKHLKIERGRPVLVRSHTFLNSQGTPLLWGETLYREEYKIEYVLDATSNPA